MSVNTLWTLINYYLTEGRVRIRNRLLVLDPHENLFLRFPGLGLPKLLASYLMYDVTVDDVSDDTDNGDD